MSQEQTADTEVLIVEDERELADVFATWLADEYTVQVAYTGEDALEMSHSGADIVLLDRRLPGISGSEVLGEMRTRGIDCQVAMVSAVKPTTAMLTLDIDEYVRKPVAREELLEVVGELERRNNLGDERRQFLAAVSKTQALEGEQSADGLVSNPQYQELLSDVAQHGMELDEALAVDPNPNGSTRT